MAPYAPPLETFVTAGAAMPCVVALAFFAAPAFHVLVPMLGTVDPFFGEAAAAAFPGFIFGNANGTLLATVFGFGPPTPVAFFCPGEELPPDGLFSFFGTGFISVAGEFVFTS